MQDQRRPSADCSQPWRFYCTAHPGHPLFLINDSKCNDGLFCFSGQYRKPLLFSWLIVTACFNKQRDERINGLSPYGLCINAGVSSIPDSLRWTNTIWMADWKCRLCIHTYPGRRPLTCGQSLRWPCSDWKCTSDEKQFPQEEYRLITGNLRKYAGYATIAITSI